MGQLRRWSCCAFVFLGVWVSPSASADPAPAQSSPRTYYAFCFSQAVQPTPGGPMTEYSSGVFAIPDPAPYFRGGETGATTTTHNATGNANGGAVAPGQLPWTAQFNQYLAQTYAYKKGGAECQWTNTLEESQARLRSLMQGERNLQKQVVETGWKYGYAPPDAPPVQTSPPAAAAPVRSAQVAAPVRSASPSSAAHPAGGTATDAAKPGAARAAFCWAQVQGVNPTTYFSATFEAATPNVAGWSNAFKSMLVSRYHFSGLVHCPVSPSLAEAQDRLQQLKELLTRSHFRTVDTGWKSE